MSNENDIFNVETFNLISDDENYYFFRALDSGDNNDLEKGIIKDENGNLIKIRTDCERWNESKKSGEKSVWTDAGSISLEEIFKHIKIHQTKDTNCISLTSNANVVRTYGRDYDDKFVLVKVPKSEYKSKCFNAGEYMLDEIEKRVNDIISSNDLSKELQNTLNEINEAKTIDDLKNIVEVYYSKKNENDRSKPHPKKGINYNNESLRITSWQALNDEQLLEKNKIIAKLTVLERKLYNDPELKDKVKFIKNSPNNNLLVETVGSAFASCEQIYYGDISGDKIIDLPKNVVNLFAMLQQIDVDDSNKELVESIKIDLLNAIYDPKNKDLLNDDTFKDVTDEFKLNDSIDIGNMYDFTNGKVEYGKANHALYELYYLSKSKLNAKELTKYLKNIINDPKYNEIYKELEKSTYSPEPEILTRRSGKGEKISESVNLDINDNEKDLIKIINSFSDDDLKEVLRVLSIDNKDTEDLVEKKENIFTKILEKIKMFIKGKNK